MTRSRSQELGQRPAVVNEPQARLKKLLSHIYVSNVLAENRFTY